MVSILLSACYKFQGTSIPPDLESYSVGFFENKSAQVNPKLGQSITEKLKDKMNNTRLNFTRENGDFNFNGTITGYTITPVTVQENAAATQSRLTITVSVQFNCPKHPELNFDQNFSSFQDFDATKNFTSLENNLAEGITDQLVQEIFNKAAVNW
ncbi:MAG: LptE family protein [Bacteroidia bacterium]